MNEEKYISITRSYSHKLVPENHGIDGHRFAPLDFFASYGKEIPVDATPEVVRKESDNLHELAKTDVEKAIAETIEGMKHPKEEGLNADELDTVAEFVSMVAKGSSLKEFEAAVTEKKDKLNPGQLDFLRNLARTLK